MSRIYLLLAFCLILCFPVGPAFGVSLFFQPTDSIISPGETIDINISIDGLVASTPPPFFGFSAEITFDRSILHFNSVAFGSAFGNPFDNSETIIFTGFNIDKLQIFLGSRLSETELLPLQPESFFLAALTFTGQDIGVSPLDIVVGVADRQGNEGPIFGTPVSISVQPTTPGPVVPEPSTILLLATGLLMMYQWRKHLPSAN
ncbi:MAG: PEP-CTERM sorting domain-containing protein [Nitrospirales bacterium]